MPPRRHSDPEPTPTRTDTEPPPAIEPKPANPMREALAAQGKLDRINKRESDYIGNAKVRYQAERDAVMVGLSDAVKRILEAAAGTDS